VPEPIELAILGGSGFYEMPGLRAVEELDIATPFGKPSDPIRIGTLGGKRIAFLARHGRKHHLLPSELPQQANFWALKSLGVSRVLAVSAVGSLREDYAPGQLVVPNQIIDRTRGTRPSTFFGNGVVAHVAFGEPFCWALQERSLLAARDAGAITHSGGTYVVIEGPTFGTRGESELYRSWGASLVGMTALPEAKLAREAELCYAMLATVTDYDAWHEQAGPVDAEIVMRRLTETVETTQKAVGILTATLADDSCDCGQVLNAALVTPPMMIAEESRDRLAPILQRRLEKDL